MFGKEKIEELTRSHPDRALEALGKGDVPGLIYYLSQMMVGHKEVDLLGGLTQINMHAFLYNNDGEDVLETVMQRAAEQLVAPYVDLYKKDEKRALEEIIALYRNQVGAQMSPVKEDAEEIEYHLAPCGSGGSPAFAELYAMGHGVDKEGVPMICRACKKWQGAFNEAVGDDVWTMTPGQTAPGTCQMKLRKKASGDGADLFTRQELWLNSKMKPRQALDRVLFGDLDVADLIEGQLDEWIPWHDFMVRWLEYVFAFVQETYGLDYYDDFMSQTYDVAFEPLYPQFAVKTDEESLTMLANIWHYHVAKFRVEEDENRFAFVLDPCGSGGRLYRSEMHLDSFRYGGELAPIIKEKHKIAFNRENAPSYCTHCASSNRAQFSGRPLVFIVDGHAQSKPGVPCRQYLYKSEAPRQVETALLEQVSMTQLGPLQTAE